MGKMRTGIKTLGIAAALLAGVWVSGASADVQSDVTSALSAPTVAAKDAALSSLGQVNANNLPVFEQVAKAVAAGVTSSGAAAAAGVLAKAAFGAVTDNSALTRILITEFVPRHSAVAGDIFAAIIAAGGSVEVATNALQAALNAAAGLALFGNPTLPPNNPGTGPNYTSNPGWVKSEFTSRLGNINDFTPTAETPQSPTGMTQLDPPTLN